MSAQAIRRHPRAARLVGLTAALLIGGACHSIDENAFAHNPVPLAKLAFHEPIAFTGGAADGQVVPLQPGLLASYLAGAQYDRLDHQQIDANVNFVWDATGNPVISAPDGTDHNDGDFRLPDSWGIWSVVWEGYLLAPTEGTYVLRIHVNNGGWLEMKDPSGSLTTVINCAGGTGFEGDCDANVAFSAGPQYIRFSYFNNAPPSANAILSWQTPGSSSVEVVPTNALCTQSTASCSAPKRAFMFVHGINGDSANRSIFQLLLKPLEDRYGEVNVRRFPYFQDRAFKTDSGCLGGRSALIPADAHGLPINTSPSSLASDVCDSESNVGLDAILLDQDIQTLHRDTGAPVTLICNSMGCAIVRAYLAYSVAANPTAAPVVDNIFFLQGAQQGSWLDWGSTGLQGLSDSANPLDRLTNTLVSENARRLVGFDPNRPAFEDLRPLSPTYRFVNPDVAHVPDAIGYFNVASDIRWKIDMGILGTRFVRNPVESNGSFGDYVMLPGPEDPTRLDVLGGERFDASTIGRGRDNLEWTLRKDFVVKIETYVVLLPILAIPDQDWTYPTPPLVPDPFALAESHFQLGSKMHEITTQRDRRTGLTAPLDELILNEIYRQDP
ncbi:MAG TPA: PA14 domain-containing protein [Candidatus Limnocylindria bacterium]|nr:PA14 domain-containing protein [Candidatus Limnocylindria bacterium]